jgi:hypothetical protein
VNTTNIQGFVFVLLFSLTITFLHSCGGNISIIAARNAWVGYSVCLCVVEDRSCAMRWMVEGTSTLKGFVKWTEEGKHNRQYEGEHCSSFWEVISSRIGNS